MTKRLKHENLAVKIVNFYFKYNLTLVACSSRQALTISYYFYQRIGTSTLDCCKVLLTKKNKDNKLNHKVYLMGHDGISSQQVSCQILNLNNCKMTFTILQKTQYFSYFKYFLFITFSKWLSIHSLHLRDAIFSSIRLSAYDTAIFSLAERCGYEP
ncbi:hypothetical protein T07_12650 [Trichinella nelsoni]|uniref:Uncharacterized protein n=1 Tax=Trichinella nelsoni TaxID=6336 RepID=A0A0V0S4Z0_9BILA|nr:hypothetical protein T07_12650 [Trichinella nelsoni]